MSVLVFTPKTIKKILSNWKSDVKEFTTSSDLGKTETKARIEDDKLIIEREKIDLKKIKKVKEEIIYFNHNGELKPLMIFSDKTNRLYKLVPTKDYPTIMISGSPMHQITFSTPKKDTSDKVRLLGNISNKRALDTCFGLGYSAIELAKRCKSVHTFENDDAVIEIAQANPYSKEAFIMKNIALKKGDVFEEIKKFQDESFDVVLHDPPTPSIAPLLFSREFYRQISRVLKKNGLLYHYTPMPGNKKNKRDFPSEVRRKLVECGFKIIKYSESAQGFLAKKD